MIEFTDQTLVNTWILSYPENSTKNGAIFILDPTVYDSGQKPMTESSKSNSIQERVHSSLTR